MASSSILCDDSWRNSLRSDRAGILLLSGIFTNCEIFILTYCFGIFTVFLFPFIIFVIIIIFKLFHCKRLYIKGIVRRWASKCAWQIIVKLEASGKKNQFNSTIQQSQKISMNCLQKTAMRKDIKFELDHVCLLPSFWELGFESSCELSGLYSCNQ